MGDIRSVLFVCTGNSCRSVMAEGLLKKYLNESDNGQIEVYSAGVGAAGGFPPTLETLEVLKKVGIDASGHRSKKITAEMIKDASLIFVMEEMHRDEVIRMAPEAAGKTYLLKEFKSEKKQYYPDIPDPIGRPMKDYEQCFQMIKEEIERIAKLL